MHNRVVVELESNKDHSSTFELQCTAPHKPIAIAESFLGLPSCETMASQVQGFDLSAVVAMAW